MTSLSPYLELTKPRLTLLVLATTLIGFYLASPPRDILPVALLIHTLLGSAFLGGGMNALNQYLERSIDAKMQRTINRPIPSGRVKDHDAFLFGILLVLAGVLWLYFFVNVLTSMIGILTTIVYLVLYTPLKQRTALNTFVGAIPGALPCLIGWSARQNGVDWQAWALFLILFFWQLPHFFAIAWVYKEDYGKSGLVMLTQKDPDGRMTGQRTVVSALVLFPITLLPVWAGLAGNLYLILAIVSGLFFVGSAISMHLHRMKSAKSFISLSIFYLLWLLIAMLFDRARSFYAF